MKEIVSNRFLARVVYCVVLVSLVAMFANPFRVEGHSMMPNFRNNQVVFINRTSVISGNIHKGDVVIARVSGYDRYGFNKKIIKRVIGEPLDHIVITGGNVYINGKKIDEPYLIEAHTAGEIIVDLNQDEFYLLGDNRKNSIDSRDYRVGPVKLSKILGKVY